MHAKLLPSLLLAVVFAAVSTRADTIVAFSGSSCDGSAGATVQCDGSCHQFAGRHSVRVCTSGGTHCISYFENNACNFQESLGGTSIVNGNQCSNVNTGGPVNSFICAPNTICLVW
ncbi:hypothetical protein BJ165DRAFT_1355826 [Panaeolus papilionaceus]|nr:hypothetical protein BJ165DRAFT_1355826 [Panaeolus papilionaceus]